jgi:uncharacterized phage protein gp47/JayE
MPWERPTIKELIKQSKADTESRMPGASAEVRRKALAVVSTVRAGALHGVHGRLEYEAKNLLPVKGCSFATTLRWAKFFKMMQKTATKATAQWVAEGTAGAPVPAGQKLQRSDGIEYVVDNTVEITSNGTATVPVTACAVGASGNAVGGIALDLVTPLEGVQPSGVLSEAGAIGGSDTEADEDFQARVAERLAVRMTGSNEAYYIAKAKEVPGVTRAWCIPHVMGRGTVGVTFVCDRQAGSIIPSDAKVAEVKAHFEDVNEPASGQLPGRSVTAEVWVFAPVAKPLNPRITITPDTAEIRKAAVTEMEDMLSREAVPGGTIHLSVINEAISIAQGETRHTLHEPTGPVTCLAGEIVTLGDPTWV